MAQPVVGLSEVIEDDAAAVTAAGRQDDGGGGVSFAGHPGRVEGVCDEEEGHDQNHPTGNLVGTCRGSAGSTSRPVGPSTCCLFKTTEIKDKRLVGFSEESNRFLAVKEKHLKRGPTLYFQESSKDPKREG